MTFRINENIALVLLALLSLGSFVLVEEDIMSLAASLAAFAIGLVKINLVFGSFMHLGWRHRPWRQVLTVWLAAVAVILATGLAVLSWE